MTAPASLFARLASAGRDAELWAGAVWMLSSVAAVVAAVTGSGWWLASSLLVGYLAEYLLYDAPEPRISGWLARREMGAVDRALFREAVAVIGLTQLSPDHRVSTVLALATILVLHATHAAYRIVSRRHQRERAGRIVWRGLDVGGALEGPEVLPPTLLSPGNLSGPRVVLLLDVFLVGGLVTTALTDDPVWVGVGCAAVLVGAVWVGWRVLARTQLIRRLPSPAEENARLSAALVAHAPEVAVYFSGGPDTTYQLNVWLETIDRLHQPAVIILRERLHLEELLPTTTPVVVLPRARDVEDFQVPTVRVALYPTTVIKNNHMIRLTGIRHVFINHGDGDKSVTFSALHRVFDEIWVAGQAACDRYLTRGEGFRPGQLVTVGRPQLAHIHPRGDVSTDATTTRRTVLYAPTWEGNFDDVDYSSVAPMGDLLIDTLLDPALGIRVLFKAHPATGTRLAKAGAVRAHIERRIREAGGDHKVVGSEPNALYDAFNEADVLVSDISSVVADFLASRKPYLVTNPRRRDVESFHREFPSTTGGAIVPPDAQVLREAIVDALGEDRLRPRREELATYFLGAPVADPVERFAAEVDAALTRAPALRELGELEDHDEEDDE